MLTKVHIVKAMVFFSSHVRMWELDYKKGWAPKVWCFKLWYWGRLLTVPWIVNRNQSNLKEINPEYSLEGLMLKLKIQYFGRLMWRVNSLEKTLILGRLKAGGEGDNRGWDGWMASPTRWTWVWASSRIWWRTGKPGVLQGSQRVRHKWATEPQQQQLHKRKVLFQNGLWHGDTRTYRQNY